MVCDASVAMLTGADRSAFADPRILPERVEVDREDRLTSTRPVGFIFGSKRSRSIRSAWSNVLVVGDRKVLAEVLVLRDT